MHDLLEAVSMLHRSSRASARSCAPP